MKTSRRLFASLVSLVFIFSVCFSAVSAASTGTVLYDVTWCPGTMVVNEKAVSMGETLYKKKFVKYLSSSWAKASFYTWGKSISVSGSVSAGVDAQVSTAVIASLGTSLQYTQTYQISVTIPANTKYYSKLGFASDFHRQFFRYTETVGGQTAYTYDGYVETPTRDNYLIVYYKY